MATREERVILRGEDKASREFKKAESSFSRMSANIKRLAISGGIAIGISQLARMGKEAVLAAVDAEEAGAAFETTFGSAVSRASAFVEEFANMAGFSRAELQQLMAVNGNVVQGMGATEAQSAALSERMVRLAGDVASFSNAAGGAQSVLLALQSAINGEREALKTYGLAISETEVQQRALTMTGKTQISELTRMDKALATVEVAYDKAAKAVGDLERTQDSSANTLRRVNALWKEQQIEIGQALLPALKALLPVIGNLVPILGDVLVPIFTTLGVALGAIAPLLQLIAEVFEAVPAPVLAGAAALVIFSGKAGGLTNMLLKMVPSVNVLGKASFPRMGSALTSLTSFINPVTIAVGLAVAAFVVWKKKTKENEERAAAFADTLDVETAAITENTVAWVRSQLAKDDDLKTLNDLGVSVEDFIELLDDESEAREELIGRIDEQIMATDISTGAGLDEAKQLSDLKKKIKEMTGARQDGTAEIEEMIRSERLLSQADKDAFATAHELQRQYNRNISVGQVVTQTMKDQANAQLFTTSTGLKLTEAGWAWHLSMQAQAIAADIETAELDRLAQMHTTLAGEIALAAEEQRSLTSALKEAADPVFAAVSSYGRYKDALAAAEELQKTGKATAEELALAQLEIAKTAIDAQLGLDALDPTSMEKALDAIALALGAPRSEVQGLLQDVGILSGSSTRHVIDIDVRVNDPKRGLAAVSSGSGGARITRRHSGGIPGGAGLGDIPALLEPGEFVLRRTGLKNLAGLRGFGPLMDLAQLLAPPAAAQAPRGHSGPSSSRPVNLTIMLDRRVLARAVLPAAVDHIKVVAGSNR